MNTKDENFLKRKEYLKQELIKYLSGVKFLASLKSDSTNKLNFAKKSIISKSRNYRLEYLFLILKRFLVLNLIVFIFQYITCINLKSLWPAYPMFPPLGIAFVMFYFFGGIAFLGLFLAEALALFLNDFSLITIFLYLIGDIAGGYLGASLSQNTFKKDIRIFSDAKSLKHFILINALITSTFSSVYKLIALIVEQIRISNKAALPFLELVYNFIELWLSDLNALLVIGGLLLSWISVPFSRERIIEGKFNKQHILMFLLILIASIYSMKTIDGIFIIVIAMYFSLFLGYRYGSLVITANMFIYSSLYLAYFIGFKEQYLITFTQPLYGVVILGLSIYVLICLYLAHRWEREKYIINQILI